MSNYVEEALENRGLSWPNYVYYDIATLEVTLHRGMTISNVTLHARAYA